jgi:enoyl-CoA hydratase
LRKRNRAAFPCLVDGDTVRTMRIEWSGEVALARAEAGRANAIGSELLDWLGRLPDELDRAGARAAVITGYGRYFSAGLDLPSLYGLDRPMMGRYIEQFEDTMLRLFEWPRPLVAAVNGHAIAGGCVLALQADYRVMGGGDARIGLNESQLGIGLPSVVMETLRAQLPVASLPTIALEGRVFLPEEARELGLVDEVVPPQVLEQRALGKAQELAAVPAAAWMQIKRALRRPSVEAVRAQRPRDTEQWLDTWFSPEARRRLGETVARVTRRAKERA